MVDTGDSALPSSGSFAARGYMNTFESTNHSFVIRVSLALSTSKTGQVTWRGQIIHVPSGNKGHLEELDDVVAFIIPYLEAMGVRFGIYSRVRRWLWRQKLISLI